MRIGLGIHVGNRKKASGKKAGQITVFPTALALTYNGNAQTLITAGEGTGVMLYKLGDGEWSENLPQATDAGTYTIYYKSSESKKYKESAEYSIETSVAKVTPNLVVPTPKVLTYNTKAQELVVAGSTDWGTLKYSLDNTNWGTEIPKAKNAGVYTLYYRVDGDDNINSIAADSILAPIAEKRVTDPTIVLSQDNYTYNGSACEPTPTVYDGSVIIPSEEYTVSYANNINAGTATVIISDVVDGNYYVIGTTTFAIAKANATCTAPTTKSGLVYSGSVQSLVDAGTASGGTMYYSLGNENWSTDIPTATNAGSYTIYYKVVGDANHNDIAAASVSNSIAKANATYTLPTSKSGLVYNATSIQLVNAGSTNDGTIEYKLDDSEWSTNIPTAINAGSYVVQWRLVGDSNHNDVAASNINVSIAKVTPTVVAPTAKGGLVYDGTAQTLANAGSTNWGTLQYSLDNSNWGTSVPTAENAGSYTLYYRVVGDSNINNVAAANINVSIAKAARTLSFVSVPDTLDKEDTAVIAATPSAGANDGTISYSSSNSGVLSVNGNVVTGVAAGNATLTATISEGQNYLGASVTHNVVVVVVNYSERYLTFVPVEDSTFQFSDAGLSYSLDNGSTWTALAATKKTPTVAAGSKILWKNNTTLTPLESIGIGRFSSSKSFDVKGNIMSLLFGDNFIGQTSLSGYNYAFFGLFDTTNVRKANNLILPATTLANYCYQWMFRMCSTLTSAPTLPATILTLRCYDHMFQECTSLTTAPTLSATTLAKYCYAYMFNGCTSLSYVKMLATDISATSCLSSWLSNVAASGTFVKASGATIPSGGSGIPSGWTVQQV